MHHYLTQSCLFIYRCQNAERTALNYSQCISFRLGCPAVNVYFILQTTGHIWATDCYHHNEYFDTKMLQLTVWMLLFAPV